MTSKRKHITLSIKDKVDIIKSLESGTTVTALAKEYNVGKATICNIKQNKGKIVDHVAASYVSGKKRKTLKLSAFPMVDKAVYTWFLQERSKGKQVRILNNTFSM